MRTKHTIRTALFPAIATVALGAAGGAQTITEIIDQTGDGNGNGLDEPNFIAVSPVDDAVYVNGARSNNVFRIQPGGTITEIIDQEAGDGPGGLQLLTPRGIAVDAAGNVYIAGSASDNVLMIAPPNWTVKELINSTGAGFGKELKCPWALTLDGDGNLFVTGHESDNAFIIMNPSSPSPAIVEIIDASGDGGVNGLDGALAIAVFQSTGTKIAYVSAETSNNIFSITNPGQPYQTINCLPFGCSSGGPAYGLDVDGAGNLYVACYGENLGPYMIDPGGTVQQIPVFPVSLDGPYDIVVDDLTGDVYLTGRKSDNALRIQNPGPTPTPTEIIDSTGDGLNGLDVPLGIAVNRLGDVFVAGSGDDLGLTDDNVFKIGTPWPVPPGMGYCFGDPGSGLACPCGNDNDGSVPGSGCANGAFASGAHLTGSGDASVSSDTLVLTTTGLHQNNTGLYFQAKNAVNGGSGSWFGDGLRCAGGGLIRLQVRTSDSSGTSSTTIAIASKGGVAPGDTKRYQCWYRDTSGAQPCGVGVNDFNLSNGYEITWLP